MRRLLAILLMGLTASVTIMIAPPPALGNELARQTDDPTARPLGAITVLGDSVLLGSLYTTPSLVDQLASQGWGPIRARAGASYFTGYQLGSGETKIEYWINKWRSEGWDPTNIVVNLGANDAAWCNHGPEQINPGAYACSRAAIEYVLNAIGPGHRVWWPTITHVYNDIPWNQALTDLAAERDDLWVWDWNAEMKAGNYVTPDAVHLDAAGYRRRSALMAIQITQSLAAARPSGSPAELPAGTATSNFVPITSTRALDTRSADGGGRVAAGSSVRVDVGDIAPSDAVAVAAYITAVNPGSPGFLATHACGSTPTTSSIVNYMPGQVRGAVTIMPLAQDASLCVYSHAEADVTVDVQGAFVPTVDSPAAESPATELPTALQLVPLDKPQRLLDTRPGSPQTNIEVDVGDDAEAVAINLTAIADQQAGFLTAYPCDQQPGETAAVNYLVGDVIAGAAFVPVSDDGTVCISSSAPVDVIIDLSGRFVSVGQPAGLSFVPVPPTRTIDTRDGIGGWLPIHGSDQTIDAPVAPANAKAVSGTLTIAFPVLPAFLTAWGCGDQPPTSNINAGSGVALANFVTAAVDQGKMCVYSNSATGSVFDTTGWWVTPEP